MNKNPLFWFMVIFWVVMFLIIIGLITKTIATTNTIIETGQISTFARTYLIEDPKAKAERYSITRKNVDLLVDEIIKRESGGIPTICNKQYGCRAGMGLMGFISSTWNKTIERIKSKKEIIPGYYSELNNIPERCLIPVKLPMSKERIEVIFDGECNRMVGTWLLIVDGLRHWNPYSGDYDLVKYKLVGTIKK